MRYKTREDYVEEFHEVMGQAIEAPFSYDLLKLRAWLLREELEELDEELANAAVDYKKFGKISPQQAEKILKEMADLQYVLSGLAVTFGLPLQEAFMRVHKSNMSKLGDDGKPVYREDGKVLKSDNYKPADLSDLVS